MTAYILINRVTKMNTTNQISVGGKLVYAQRSKIGIALHTLTDTDLCAWNHLPYSVVNAQSVNIFIKNTLDIYLGNSANSYLCCT